MSQILTSKTPDFPLAVIHAVEQVWDIRRLMAHLKSIDFLIGLFGYSRISYSNDSHVVDAIMSALKDCGAVKCGESGMPTAFTNYHFRIRGRQVKLQVEDYEDIILWGPKRLVLELSNRISDKLSKVKNDAA